MPYTRTSPSARYQALLDQYRQMHREGGAQMFPGKSLVPQLAGIKRLVAETGAQTILDYGCGKALAYNRDDLRFEDSEFVGSIVDYWDVAGVHFYDPCHAPFSRLPEGQFDGVICTDVLEHCPEEDLPWIVGEIFSFSRQFVYANVACYPAQKRLPNGENAHCTVRSAAWWREVFEKAAACHPALAWELWVRSVDAERRAIDERLSNVARAA